MPLLVQAAAATCACEDDLASVNHELATMKAELAELRVLLTQPKKYAGTARATVDASSGLVAEDRRRLSHGSAHYAAVPALQVHEFPNGGSCQPGTRVALLPQDRSTTNVVWSPTTSDGTSNLALTSITDITTSPWTTSTVQTIPAPFKIVHDATCAQNPSLNLPLDTTFAGGVTVGGRQLAPNVCIRISTTNTGPLNAWVADSRGELNALDDGTSGIGSTAGSIGSTLTNGQNLNACYTGFRTLYVNGADPNDGWIGSLEVSLDGGTSWTYLVCAAGCIRGHSGQEVLVHYEFTSTSGTTTVAKCINMGICSFILP